MSEIVSGRPNGFHFEFPLFLVNIKWRGGRIVQFSTLTLLRLLSGCLNNRLLNLAQYNYVTSTTLALSLPSKTSELKYDFKAKLNKFSRSAAYKKLCYVRPMVDFRLDIIPFMRHPTKIQLNWSLCCFRAPSWVDSIV